MHIQILISIYLLYKNRYIDNVDEIIFIYNLVTSTFLIQIQACLH